ncbi:hypothetical protein HXX76_006109 [Chlamydomonas incerta]|uniref:ceramide glucosyltransferase n=1 Tax=Chlamydomonas incerta TaxID=51695 RepID=A0A835W545_CHLIN|nr:hypothetical protein HXX76_006109 [Chlamydomonas incerta]|eukprot:KAG2437459.1 hypothetical protein HXX76_006109 [Chlamydomonas incerta]
MSVPRLPAAQLTPCRWPAPQHQALFLWLVLAAGWTWSGLNRRRERLRRVALRRAAGAGSGAGSGAGAGERQPAPPTGAATSRAGGSSRGGKTAHDQRQLPPLSVVMPVKGCRPHSEANWESQLRVTYGGPIEFVFVVESLEDPAVPVLQRLAAAHTGVAPAVAGAEAVAGPSAVAAAAAAGAGPQAAVAGAARQSRRVRLVVAGLTTTCSQKAHNLCAGIEACSSLAGWADAAAAAEEAAAASSAQRHPPAVAAAAAVAGDGPKAEQAEDGGWVMVEGGPAAAAATATSTSTGFNSAGSSTAAGSSGSIAAGGYVLCLDDDVQLHPGSVAELVAEMEADPGLFMATGYPFDVLPPGAALPAHLAASYHLPLLIAFSVVPDTAFVWGGCMALRRRHLTPADPAGLLAVGRGRRTGVAAAAPAWRDGGYSDDLIAASFCTQRRLRIRVPPFAIFPQRLDGGMTWRQWLNYLHRQLFVLDTYAGAHNRATNHTMMAAHAALSWLLVLPSLAALATALSRLLGLACLAAAAALAPLLQLLHGSAPASAAAASEQQQQLLLLQPLQSLAALALPPQLLPQLQLSLGQLAAGAAGAVAASDAAPAVTAKGAVAAAAGQLGPLLLQLFPSGVLAVALGWALAHAALVFMTAEILGLFRELSPPQPPCPILEPAPSPSSPASSTASSTAPDRAPPPLPRLRWYRWGRLWAGLLASNAALPLVMAWAYLSPRVEWGGVLYHKRRGRVVPVRRRLYPGGPWGPPIAAAKATAKAAPLPPPQ